MRKNTVFRLQRGSCGLTLEGAVKLELSSTTRDFDEDTRMHVFVWPQDWAGASCTTIASTDLCEDERNGGVEDWAHDAWGATSAGRPSGIEPTVASS